MCFSFFLFLILYLRSRCRRRFFSPNIFDPMYILQCPGTMILYYLAEEKPLVGFVVKLLFCVLYYLAEDESQQYYDSSPGLL